MQRPHFFSVQKGSEEYLIPVLDIEVVRYYKDQPRPVLIIKLKRQLGQVNHVEYEFTGDLAVSTRSKLNELGIC